MARPTDDCFLVHVFTTGKGKGEKLHHFRVEQVTGGMIEHVVGARLELVHRLEVLGYVPIESSDGILRDLGTLGGFQKLDVINKDKGIVRKTIAYVPK